ncbi:histidine kinase [Aestuariibaculum sp. YM273]|uniref:sensor histidine kinase n=1 Tax=Aestuariibaculum sp. YM273 TaxID=3070659 RepID=UPI0027DABABD|nr:histidine kinase [Aestuariibaculum sp. YM273]WMI65336.1 histidine kinase [Aestuariibaculum sp. YM273]
MSTVSNLPDIEFYDIVEDNNKAIWLAADKGLYRYNGRSYIKTTHQEQHGNSVFGLKLDKHGRLWCNNIYGQLFYVENNTMYLFFDANKITNGQLVPFEVYDLKIRLFTEQGVFEVDKNTKKVSKVNDWHIMSVSQYNNEDFVFLLDNNAKIISSNSDEMQQILEIDQYHQLQSAQVFALSHHVFVNYRFEGKNTIYIIDKATKRTQKLITPELLVNRTIYRILEIDNTYWFCTDSGVYLYDYSWFNLKLKSHYFKGESISKVVKDFNGNYWFSTLDNGIFVSQNIQIKTYNLDDKKNKITSFCALKDNRFVFGTNNGKILFYKKGILEHSIHLPRAKPVGQFYYDDKKQALLVSLNVTKSYVIDLTNYKVTDAANKFAVAKSFSALGNENLFYGNYKEGIIYHNPLNSDSLSVLRDKRVKTSWFSKGKSLYISFIDGLYEFKNNTLKEIIYEGESVLINEIAETDGSLWFATQHYGLIRFYNSELEPMDLKVLNDKLINSIVGDGKFLWILTDSELIQYDTLTQQIKILSTQDGVDASSSQLLVLKDDILIIKPNIFYKIPKQDSVFKTHYTAPLNIKSVFVNDSTLPLQEHYVLDYNQNNIGLEFNSNGFLSDKYVQYAYRISETDNVWHNVPLGVNKAVFNNLNSGKYTVEVKALNTGGKEGETLTPIRFEISKPFWEASWFYSLVSLCLIIIIWMIFNQKLKKKEQDRLAEIDKILSDKKITNLRLENLRSQMNPHFIFNALNSIQDYIISNERELASSYLVKFSRLIRLYLNYSQQNEITLSQEIDALKLYLELEKIRFAEELNYEILVDSGLNTNQIKVPSLFVQPYIENALKHGLLHKSGERKLSVSFNEIRQTNSLEIIVEDNGVGRQASEAINKSLRTYKSFATKANQERVFLYKHKLKREIDIDIEDLYDDQHQPKGTRVTIKILIK